MIDVIKAMLDPTMVFEDPMNVVANVELTRDQKIEILRRWEYDARQLEVAEEEAGMAVRRPEMFDRVLQALHTLGVERDITHCQTHHRSSHTYIVLKALGFPRIKGYPGSWSEWGNDFELPIET